MEESSKIPADPCYHHFNIRILWPHNRAHHFGINAYPCIVCSWFVTAKKRDKWLDPKQNTMILEAGTKTYSATPELNPKKRTMQKMPAPNIDFVQAFSSIWFKPNKHSKFRVL
jgi:hypothetical protein